MKRWLLPLCLLPLLAACNPRTDTGADEPTGHVWQSQVDSLEQARSAGQQAAAAARQTDQ